MKSSDRVKSVTGLLALGKSDFEAIEPFRQDRFFKRALGISKVPGAVWLRQRLDKIAPTLRDLADELSLRLLTRTDAPVTAQRGFVCLDIDTFVMDNSGSHKESVSRTYQGVDGYTPIAAYLGNESWCVGLELRPGSQHSVAEFEYFLERLFPRVKRLVAPEAAVLMRKDSGFDAVRVLFACACERDAWAQQGRSLDYLIKWNPRKQNLAAWVQRAEDAQAFQITRPGKRVAHLDLQIPRAWKKQRRDFRLIVQITERTIDKRGQHLLMPEIELQGGWTSLSESPDSVIERYRQHGTHEQFHSEFKSDLGLERLPSGKFDTNDAILSLAMLAYNSLRLMGQLGLTGEITPIRHPAQRRRLKTVLQEVMNRAAKLIHHARRWILDFGHGHDAHVKVFARLQARLRTPQPAT